MSSVKIHCALGLNLFGFYNSKTKKWRHFVKTIAPWLMPVRQSLWILHRCGSFIVAFTSEKWKMTINKSLLAIDTRFFHRAFAILVWCKTKGAARAVIFLLLDNFFIARTLSSRPYRDHYCKRAILFLSSFKILRAVCPPTATKAGGTHSPGGEGEYFALLQ